MSVPTVSGLDFCLAGFLVGRWWFPVADGVAVFIFGTAASDLEADPAAFGMLAGLAVAFVSFFGTAVRWAINWIVREARSRVRARRGSRG